MTTTKIGSYLEVRGARGANVELNMRPRGWASSVTIVIERADVAELAAALAARVDVPGVDLVVQPRHARAEDE